MKARWDFTLLIALFTGGVGFGLGKHFSPRANLSKSPLLNPIVINLEQKQGAQIMTPPGTPAKPLLSSDTSSHSSNTHVPSAEEKIIPSEIKKEFHTLLKNQNLDRLTQAQWTRGEVKKSGTSGVDEYIQELLADGSSADRWYRKDGSLSKENLTFPSDKKAFRSFFENGKVKLISHTLTDGTTIYLQFDSSGFPTQRTIQKPDGSHYWTEYDDHGNPTQTYWAPLNGTAILI